MHHQRKISEEIAENFSEIINVLGGLFNRDGGAHLKLSTVHMSPDPLPKELVEFLDGTIERIDTKITIDGYGEGHLSAVVIPKQESVDDADCDEGVEKPESAQANEAPQGKMTDASSEPCEPAVTEAIEIDHSLLKANWPTLKSKIGQLTGKGPVSCHLDLTEHKTLNSQTLGNLVVMNTFITQASGQLTIKIKEDTPLMMVIKTTHLDAILNIEKC